MIVLLGAGVAHAQMPPVRSYVGSGPTSAERPAAERPADEPEVRLTLPEAVYLGLRRNPAVRGAYLERVLDQFNLHVAESRFSPVGSITGSIGVDRTGSTRTSAVGIAPTVQMLTPLGTTIQFGWDMRQRGSRQPDGGTIAGISALNASLVQPLLRGAGVDAATAPLRQARLQERYAQLRLKAVVSDTVTDILRAYHQFIQTRQQIVLARAALRRAHELEATSRALIRAGRMAEADLVQAQTTVVNQDLALLQAESAFDAARLSLLGFLALDLRTRLVPADELTAEPVRVELAAARALAFDNRPDFLSQQIAIEAARIGLDVARNQRLWDLSLVAGVDVPSAGRTAWRSTGRLADNRTDPRAGLQLTIPINNLAAAQQEVQATVDLGQGEIQLERIRTLVDRQVRDAVRTLDAAWRRYGLTRQARELAARTLDAETAKLRAGRSSNFQVVSFQDQLRLAENAELVALIGYLDALVGLDQQLGTTLDTWRIQLNDTGS